MMFTNQVKQSNFNKKHIVRNESFEIITCPSYKYQTSQGYQYDSLPRTRKEAADNRECCRQ